MTIDLPQHCGRLQLPDCFRSTVFMEVDVTGNFSRGLAGLILAALLQPATAQELGDARNGLTYASQVCAECHAVRVDQTASPNARAPRFEAVANSRGMSEMALRVWFQSPHPSMPNLVLSKRDSDDVIAYILSLRKR